MYKIAPLLPEIGSEQRNKILQIFVAELSECRAVFFVFFYRLSIVTLTQHLQAPAFVSEEGTMKDLARVKGWKE